MPIDTTPSTVATNALQAIPFSTLIGGPLDAAIKAQAMAAQTSWEFIKQVGLNPVPNSDQMEARNVTFYYNKNGQMTKLIVPLLTIVPIPYIAIDNVQIDFKANISASSSSVTSTSDSSEASAGGSAKASFGFGLFSVSAEFQANYSSKKDSKASEESKYAVEYTMDISVHAGQSDMPAGLASILNILQSSITDANKNGTFTLSPANPEIDVKQLPSGGAFALTINANIKDNNGLAYANQPVDFTVSAPPSWLAITGLPLTATTDKNGQAVFNITGTVDASKYTPDDVDFTLTAKNDGSLTDSGVITFN
jgi:Protein of unknown function (DUF2589)/Bacterial Ig-like domain (group 1)